MASALAFSLVDRYCLARDALNEVECDLGNISALLADVADTIVDDPESLGSDSLKQWPSHAELRAMIKSRKQHRQAMQAAWARLSEQDRRRVGRMPPFGKPDPTRPLI